MAENIENRNVIIPEHIAIIPDGNRRWAKKRGLPAIAGHNAGSQQFKKIVRACNNRGVKIITFYAFSTENWKRSQNEVEQLFKLLGTFLVNFDKELGDDKDTVKIRVIGDRTKLSDELTGLIETVEKATSRNTGIIVNIAINYGARDEILRAVRMVSQKVKEGELLPEEVDEVVFSANLFTAGQKDPDLLIRTSGEERISNYLLWQLAYSELYFCDCYWPDFDETELDKAIDVFSQRQRRYGK